MAASPEHSGITRVPLTADEILSRITDAVIIVDREWRIIYANPEAARINQKAVEDFLGNVHWEEWPGAIGKPFESELRRAMREQVAVHFRDLYDHGDYHVWLDVRAFPSPETLTIFYRDISAEREAEEQLAEVQTELVRRVEQFEKLFNMMPVCLAVGMDAETSQVQPNPELARLLRIEPTTNTSASAPSYDSMPFRWMRGGRVLSPDELPQQLACRTAQPVTNIELDLVFNDGEKHKLFGNAVPLFDDVGRVRGSVAAYLDVTDQRKAEEALRRSEAVTAAAELLTRSLTS
jgi:PAS domain-containing protein